MRCAHWLAPLTVLLAVTLPHLGDGDWMRGDSGWYAAIGVQACRTGQWWTLWEAPGREYFNKPPLVFWIQGTWMSLAGIGAWQARAATIAAAALCVLAASGIARRIHGRRVALLAGALLAINIEFFRRTREISLDMWQCAFMLLGAWMMVSILGRTTGVWWRTLLAGAAIGSALMCKPFVALAAPLILGLWMVTTTTGAHRRRALIVSCAVPVIAIAVALPWHLSMISIHGDAFVSQYFGREIADRASGELIGGQRQTQPAWFYIANAGAAWTMWLAAGILGFAGCWRPHPDARGRRLRSLGIAWSLAWLVLLTAFPDRRDRYAIPMHAGLAITAASLLTGRSRSVASANRWIPVAAVGTGLALSLLPIRFQRPIHPQWPALTAWLGSNAPDGVWDGAFSGAPAARIYLETGAWPRTTRDRKGNMNASPPAGAILLYHRRGGWSPGEGEVIAWTEGDLIATRLEKPPWSPIPTPDPGE
ncbi:MAG: glycosyltransferase family 39 protein [Phycisphaerales bacterium]|nr:glycosyltransferase family 39 protein [Phycisphaerales bacterium]